MMLKLYFSSKVIFTLIAQTIDNFKKWLGFCFFFYLKLYEFFFNVQISEWEVHLLLENHLPMSKPTISQTTQHPMWTLMR